MTEVELEQLISLSPILIIGLFIGMASFFSQQQGNISKKTMLKQLTRDVLTSVILCFIVYTMLSLTEFPYMAKIGIASAIGFFGIDNAIVIIQKILSLKDHKNNQEGKNDT